MPPGPRTKACRSPRISASTCSRCRPRPGRASASTAGIVHLKGRGDFVSIFVLDLAPGAQVVAAEAPVRGGRLRALRPRQHHDRDQRRPQAQLRMGAEEPVRAAAQRPLPALQFERARARAARLDQQSRAHAQPVPQRSLRVRQRLRLSRAAGRGQVFQRRRRVHPGAARPQHVGDEFHPRSRRLRAQGLGRSAAPAART